VKRTKFNIYSTAFTASALLQGIRGKLLQLHALRLAATAKSAIADFR